MQLQKGREMSEEIEEEVIENIEVSEYEMEMSPHVGDLAGALALAQGAMDNVGKGKAGFNYNYSDLASVITVAKEPLSKNGLAISQGHKFIDNKGGTPYVLTQTLLMHSGGQWIKTSLKLPIAPMKQLSGAQMAGVAMTYGRRYSYQAILGLASADTDGVA